MSQESTTPDPVELVRRQFEAGNRRDIDAVMSSLMSETMEDATAQQEAAEAGEQYAEEAYE